MPWHYPSATDDNDTRALFLCYPPPADAMAFDALRAFASAGGRTVAVVGEWDGNTGDGRFAAALCKGFELVRRVALPQWGDTAHELTIWANRGGGDSRGGDSGTGESSGSWGGWGTGGGGGGENRGDGGDAVGAAGGGVAQATKKKSRPHLSLAACSCCGEGALAGEATPWLRRCRHCREVTYCSARCASQHARQHAAAHARRHVPFPVGCGRPDFLSEADFKDFTPFA